MPKIKDKCLDRSLFKPRNSILRRNSNNGNPPIVFELNTPNSDSNFKNSESDHSNYIG
jgi:hypothetical protein